MAGILFAAEIVYDKTVQSSVYNMSFYDIRSHIIIHGMSVFSLCINLDGKLGL